MIYIEYLCYLYALVQSVPVVPVELEILAGAAADNT